MKVLNVVFTILFVFSAALQYNDPDPWVWMPIYLFGALLCFLALKRRYPHILYIIGIAVYTIYAVYLLLEKNGVLSWINDHNSESLVQSMKATKPWIEETREFFGLLILIFALVLNMFWLKNSTSHKTMNKL